MSVRFIWLNLFKRVWLRWLLTQRPEATQRMVMRQMPSAHPGAKGLRFTERLRDLMRPKWLRYRQR